MTSGRALVIVILLRYIQEGATIIRLGTVLFGARPP